MFHSARRFIINSPTQTPTRTGDHISNLPSGRPSSALVIRAGTLCQLEFLMSLFRNNRYSQEL